MRSEPRPSYWICRSVWQQSVALFSRGVYRGREWTQLASKSGSGEENYTLKGKVFQSSITKWKKRPERRKHCARWLEGSDTARPLSQTHRQDRLQYTALELASAQCNELDRSICCLVCRCARCPGQTDRQTDRQTTSQPYHGNMCICIP